MKENKRLIAVLICAAMIIGVIRVGLKPAPAVAEVTDHEYNDSLIVWYTDESMTDYLNAMAVEYHEKGGMRVLPRLQASGEYIESVYKNSVSKEDAPDVYILSNDALEKAYLSGCAAIVDKKGDCLNTSNFPEAALDAVTYKGNKVGYPYYFETCALVYNRTYLREMITNKVLAETAKEPEESNEGEETPSEEEPVEVIPTEGTPEFDEYIENKIDEAIPSTFDELLAFADSYDAPEKVEGMFKWDVRDVFFNYFFIGNYINVGGKCGDDAGTMDVYNIDAIRAMTLFQSLNSFFAFESSDVTYNQVVDEFKEGKLVFATATSDIVGRLAEAAEAGEFEYEYGLAMIPDISEDMVSRSLSVTEAIVVNAYSDKGDEAEKFARFLTCQNAGGLYERTGKLPSALNAIDYGADARYAYLKAFADEYSYSVPMPKLMTTSNYWLLLEDAFAGVWSGKDASGTLKKLAEQLSAQISGENVLLEYIMLPKEVEEVEYLDEDALSKQAKDEDGNQSQ
ncbi:MAG: extracellular solute-binding protein [Lachnospiraceae bacterium]|nr:extracellular solute-binding protein [Lachnospiraceae bacterium]